MSDPGLRTRRRRLHNKGPDSNGKADQDQVKSRSGRKLQTLYALVLISLALILYQFSDLVVQLGEQWIGSSSEWDDKVVDLGPNLSADISKRDAIVDAFRNAWSAYERDAMGDDEYHPFSRHGSNLTEAGGIGYTIVDSIDTMLLMGLQEEYQRARDWVAYKMSLDRDANFNTFETTIRVLGGLLSAYHLSSGDPIFLDRAKDLGDRMLPAFDTPSGLPLSMVNLKKRHGVPDHEFPSLVSTAEAATLQLEFRYLSWLTDHGEYWDKAEHVMKVIKKARLRHGLASIFMTIKEGLFVPSDIRLGSRGDSYYEYLLKQYLQTNFTEDVYREMYEDAMDAIHTHLVQKSTVARLIYTAELNPTRQATGETFWRRTPKQDHLVCFLGGSLMLGATTVGALVRPVSLPPRQSELSGSGWRDWQTGVELIKTCMATHDTATGLAPEIVHFRIPSDGIDASLHAPTDWYIKGARPGEPPPYDARYMLRPETVESLFIAFRLTGDVRYREYGWNVFQAIEKHCRVETGGYATILNVDEVPAKHEDKMESFFLSETLKYLYLLFSDSSVCPLNEYVFNTEAHPLPIFEAKIGFP